MSTHLLYEGRRHNTTREMLYYHHYEEIIKSQKKNQPVTVHGITDDNIGRSRQLDIGF